MSAWDGMNRRKFPRVSYPCLITVRQDGEEPEIILTHTENIGVGGVGVIIKKNLKIFSNVDLEMDMLDTDDHVKCVGRVVWCIQRRVDEKKKPLFYDTGIEFSNLRAEDQQRIDDIVQRLVKMGRQV